MKKNFITVGLILITFCISIFSTPILAQKGGTPKSWSIGLRLGDPSGLTIKKHFGENKAFEFNVGRTNTFGNYGRYDTRFRNYYNEKYYLPYYNNGWKDKDYWKYGNGYYGSNYTFRAYAFQFHYIIHKDIKSVSGLRWYFGFGPQVKLLHYSFDYFNGIGMQSESYISANVGVDALIGIEYTFASVPLTVFTDGGLYMEVIREPFYLQGLIGVGIRYNF